MKSYKYLLTFVMISLTLLYGCDDQLDVSNPNKPETENFYTTSSQVEAAVNAAYANLQTRGLYMRHMFFMMDNMAHENAGNSQLEADKRQYLDFAFDPSHGAIRAYWESCYRGINKANSLLDNQEKVESISTNILPVDLRNRYFAEAKFLRALYYFMLVTRYGEVPLLTSVPTSDEGTPKSSVDSIYEQIIQDLEDAIPSLLPASDTENGRATVGAAQALLGKVHLYREDYEAAQTAFANVTGYSLVADYGDNFLEATEHNSESIFEVMYDETLGTGSQWNSDADGRGLAEATFRGQEYGWNDWFNVYPSDDLLDEYEAGDPRFSASFYVVGDTYAGGVIDEIPSERRAGWRKYQNYYQRPNEELNSSINPRVIRYADILLMQAEVENALGNPAEAIDFLNQIRDRVGMPRYGTTEMDAAGYPVTTQAEIFNAIVHERKVELAGEQVRFPDLVRWGLADDFLGPNGLNTGFTAGKNEVFPIPQQEINFNNKLTNADQNTGY